jgi:hypothetical protein
MISIQTIQYFNEWEMLTYELTKLALVDVFLKRYLSPYVASSILLISFEILIDCLLKSKSGEEKNN